MANQEHGDLLKQRWKIWNQWREEHPEVKPDLATADLSDALLWHTLLVDVDLSQVRGLVGSIKSTHHY
jgi:hypothetical protein